MCIAISRPIPARVVEKSAFVVGLGQAFVQQVIVREREQFDKLFGRFPLILVLVRVQFVAFVASPGIEQLANFDLKIEKSKIP